MFRARHRHRRHAKWRKKTDLRLLNRYISQAEQYVYETVLSDSHHVQHHLHALADNNKQLDCTSQRRREIFNDMKRRRAVVV